MVRGQFALLPPMRDNQIGSFVINIYMRDPGACLKSKLGNSDTSSIQIKKEKPNEG